MLDDPVHIDCLVEREDKEKFKAVARANKLRMSQALARFVEQANKTGKIPK